MKRVFGIVVIMLLIALVLTGCNRQASGSGSVGTTAEAAPVTNITMKFWSADLEEIYYVIEREFNAQNSSIKLEMLFEPSSQYWTKLISSIAAGSPTCDIATINPSYAPQMIGNGQLETITDLFDSGRLNKANYHAGSVDAYIWDDGHIYGIPRDYQTVCLIYNKRIFDEVGIPYPTNDWTWNDLLKASQAIVKRDARGEITRYGYVHNSSVMSSWLVYPYTNGGELFNPDENNGYYCNTPENVEAFQWAQDLIFKYQVSPDLRVTQELNSDGLFVNEMAAMTCYVASQCEVFADALGTDAIGISFFPYNKVRATISNCIGHGIATGIKNLDAAKEVLVYLGSREGQTPFASAIIPAYIGIKSQMEEKFSDMNFKAYLETASIAVPPPMEKLIGNAARAAIESEVNFLMFGEKNAAQALADAEELIRRQVAAEKERKGIQ